SEARSGFQPEHVVIRMVSKERYPKGNGIRDPQRRNPPHVMGSRSEELSSSRPACECTCANRRNSFVTGRLAECDSETSRSHQARRGPHANLRFLGNLGHVGMGARYIG